MKKKSLVKIYARGVDTALRSYAKRAAESALEAVGTPCRVDLTLCTDKRIHEVNLSQRGIDKPTDVLSFPMLWPDKPPCAELADPEDGRVFLGDILISVERAAEQAVEYGHGLERELAYLTVHGVLHLLGHDHEKPEDKIRMREAEETVLSRLSAVR